MTKNIELMKLPVAAQILGQSTKHVYDQVGRGVFPPGVVVRLGRAIRFHPERLLAWIEQGGTAGTAA